MIRILQAPQPPPKQPHRIGPAFARRIAASTLSSARQGNRSPVELVMVKLCGSISVRLSLTQAVSHVHNQVFLTADHLAFADLDEDIPRFQMKLLRGGIDVQ